MVSSMRTSETVPWLDFLEMNGRFWNTEAIMTYSKKYAAASMVFLQTDTPYPWFYNSAIPPTQLLNRAKPFPSPLPRRHLNALPLKASIAHHMVMPSWM